MGYLHIDNLYRNNVIQLFRECWALEKVHGTSAHIKFVPDPDHPDGGVLHLFSGEQQAAFEALFDKSKLTQQLKEHGGHITIYGECYGGKIQRQSERYGKDIKFVAFDVLINDRWLVVPEAASRCMGFDIPFVWYTKTSTDTAELNALRDQNSVQAQRNGCGDHTAEGIVLRPLVELHSSVRGERIIAKHKRDDFRETFQPRKVGETPQVLADAEAIANEWCTEMRMQHVLQKIPQPHMIEHTSTFIAAMLEDVLREAKGEIVDSRSARKAIAAKSAKMYKDYVSSTLA